MSAALTNRFFNDVIGRQKLEVLDELLHPAFQSHQFPAPPGSKREEFIDGVRAIFKAFPDMRIHVDDQVEKGDKVFTHGYWEGTHKGTFMDVAPTNKRVKVDFMDIWRSEGGKLRENWVVMDIFGLMVQLGAVHEGVNR